jgi:hypothetical protein
LIFSKTKEEHFQNLEKLFQILADSGLSLNPDKCTFAVPEIDCLGHHVTTTGISPLPSHVQPFSVSSPCSIFTAISSPECPVSFNPSLMLAKAQDNFLGLLPCSVPFKLLKRPLLFCYNILSLWLSCPWPQTAWKCMLALFCSSMLRASDNLLPFSATNFLLQKPVIPPLTVSS